METPPVGHAVGTPFKTVAKRGERVKSIVTWCLPDKDARTVVGDSAAVLRSLIITYTDGQCVSFGGQSGAFASSTDFDKEFITYMKISPTGGEPIHVGCLDFGTSNGSSFTAGGIWSGNATPYSPVTQELGSGVLISFQGTVGDVMESLGAIFAPAPKVRFPVHKPD